MASISQIFSSYPPVAVQEAEAEGAPREDHSQSSLISIIQHYSLSHGLAMYPPNFTGSSSTHAPTTVYPSPFPASSFHKALEVQKRFNQLYVKVASDEEWLSNILEDLSKYDKSFTGKLWESYQLSKKIGIKQKLSLGIFRSDYMIHQKSKDEFVIKQIEFNTISVSFGGLSTLVADLHRYLYSSGVYNNHSKSIDTNNNNNIEYSLDSLPESKSAFEIAKGLASGHNAYLKSSLSSSNSNSESSTAILMIVQPNERNIFDQTKVTNYLFSKYNIKSYRLTLSDIESKTNISKTGHLYHNESGDEISVVYYRSAYAPSDFTSEKDWKARVSLETTWAIKCPTLLMQLAGAKKVQQLLTDKEILSKFTINDKTETLNDILDTFVKIYPLDDSPLGLEARKIAFSNPENFVLKPQREGGGNNIYKQNIPTFLNSIPEDEWAGYILMELITPPNFQNTIVREGQSITDDVVSELGVFGSILYDDKGNVVDGVNYESGWLLRSKFKSSDEGGVAAGFGCVDSVYLV